MAIRKVIEADNIYEKDVFAVDVDGKISKTIIRRDRFTIAQKQSEIARLDKMITDSETQKIALQVDIDVAEAL